MVEAHPVSAVDGPSAELWADLRRSPPEAVGLFAAQELRLDGSSTGLFMAIGHDHALNLFLPLPDATTREPGLRLTGLEVAERRVLLGGAGPALYLNLSSTVAYEPMFTTISREVAQAVAAEGIEPRKAVARVMQRWQNFWRAPRGGELSRSEQVGLFAEVWLLGQVLIPTLGPEVVYRWTGPNGERHDFQGPRTHLEVKATERNEPVFRINGIEQLEPPAGRALAVATLLLREETGAPDGLVPAVRHCESLLAAHVSERDAFRDRLVSVGYRVEREDAWDRLRLRLRAADLHIVDEVFPRLTAAKIAGGLPRGVTWVGYDVDLSGMTPLEEEARASLLRGLVDG